MNDLEKVIELNIRDAEKLVEVARQQGDNELFKKATADLERWRKKKEQL